MSCLLSTTGMNEHIKLPADGIVSFCERWRVSELALFGPVMQDDFGPDNAVDVLISFDPVVRHTLFDIVRMEDELSGTRSTM